MDDLPFVERDQEEAKKAAGFINAYDFGDDDEFILNKDTKTSSIT